MLDDIMTAILPEDEQGEVPTGFAIVGHVGGRIGSCKLRDRADKT